MANAMSSTVLKSTVFVPYIFRWRLSATTALGAFPSGCSTVPANSVRGHVCMNAPLSTRRRRGTFSSPAAS
eukprot:16074755-Heterocapsa_arctica.AAC.1